MFDKPQDIIIIAAVFSLCFIVVSYGVTDLVNRGADINSTIFDNFRTTSTGTNGFGGAGVESLNSLTPPNQTSESQDNIDGIISQGFVGLINLGKMWGVMWELFNEIAIFIGIPPDILIILFTVAAISLVIVVYSWIRVR